MFGLKLIVFYVLNNRRNHCYWELNDRLNQDLEMFSVKLNTYE